MNLFRSFLNQLGLIVTAFAFAIFVWAMATGEENPGREAFFPDAISVDILTSPGLVVSSRSSDTVRVRVRAPQAVWDELQRSNFKAQVDLKSFGVGKFQIPIRISSNDPRVSVVSGDPPFVDVVLEPEKSRFMNARAEVLDTAPLGYTFKSPTINNAQIVVNGPTSLVDQVTDVIAEVYLRGARSPVDREAVLVARNAQSKEIKGITLIPSSVIVNVPVEQRVGFKDVSIKTVLRGNTAPGYWISNLVVDPSSTTIIGNADVLSKISGFVETAPVDVGNATTDLTVRATLALPEGVSILDNQTINVRVSITPIMGGQTVRRQVTVQNLRPGLRAIISPEQVEVILAGPLPNLQNLSPETALVVVDAANLGPGVYPLKPRVIGTNDPLKVQNIVPDTIQLSITDGTPTPPK